MSEELKGEGSDNEEFSMHSGGNSEEKKKELMTGKNKKQSQFARIDMLRKEDKIKKKNENRQSMKDFGYMIPDN